MHNPDGSVYIGTYTKDQWLSNNVKAYHEEICDARTKHSNGPPVVSRNQKRRINAVKRAKNKLKKLKAEVAAIQQHKANGKNDECGQDDCQNGGEKSVIIMKEMLLAVNAPKAMIEPDSFGASPTHYKTVLVVD